MSLREPKIDLKGTVFGRLTVAEPDGKDNHRNNLWLCQCSSRARAGWPLIDVFLGKPKRAAA